MMALVYAVQGAFWPVLAVHLKDLGIGGRSRGWIFATLAIGSCALPLGAGQLVDRLLSTQRFLALIYALGTGLLVVLAIGVTGQAASLFALFLTYWLLTAPAVGLSTSLALRNLARPDSEFDAVRLWGTAGWMVVGWLVSGALVWSGPRRTGQAAYEAFWIASAFSMVLAGYCLSLPDTPPLAVGDRAGSGLREALALIRRPAVTVFLVTGFGVSLTTPFVYQVMPTYLESRGLPRPWISTAFSLGQVSEIALLACMSRLLGQLGYKGLLALGIAGWALRYASLAANPPLWLAVAGILLHGLGFACFAIGGQVFIDSQAASHRRGSAQALLMVLTAGLGSLLGSLLVGEIAGQFPDDSVLVFLIPCFINVALLIVFLTGFRPLTCD